MYLEEYKLRKSMLEEKLPVWPPLCRLSPGSSSTSILAAMLMSVATLLPAAALGVARSLECILSHALTTVALPVTYHAVCLNPAPLSLLA